MIKIAIPIFCEASWTDNISNCGIGFAILKNSNTTMMAGAISAVLGSSLQAEFAVLEIAMEHARRGNWPLDKAFSNCAMVVDLTSQQGLHFAWRYATEIASVKACLSYHPLAVDGDAFEN